MNIFNDGIGDAVIQVTYYCNICKKMHESVTACPINPLEEIYKHDKEKYGDAIGFTYLKGVKIISGDMHG